MNKCHEKSGGKRDNLHSIIALFQNHIFKVFLNTSIETLTCKPYMFN